MRRSLIFTALALGAQAAWAQDTAEPVVTDPAVVEDTAETTEPAVEETAGAVDDASATVGEAAEETVGTDTDVVDEPETALETIEDPVEPPTETAEEPVAEEPVAEEPVAEEPETAEDDGTEGDSDTVVDEEPAPVHVDNRSATGAFRGGHHGTVSTMARAGLGPVFGELRSQGYGDIQIEQLGDVISVSAARGGEVRHLSYSASTGALLDDATESRGLLETIAGKLKGKPDTAGLGAGTDKGHGKGKTIDKGDRSAGKKDGGSKGHSGESKGKSGGGKGGGSGKGGGGSKGGGHKK